MPKALATAQYDLVKASRVRIADHQFGYNQQGTLDVWIESNDRGERFLSQIIAQEGSFPVRHEVYTNKCYILREKATGHYGFLDKNERGFWLHSKTFSGAETFVGQESVKIQTWLTESAS